MEICELILYACPTGEFGQGLDSFFVQSAAQVGRNTAHAYMPHATLTGFFHDTAESIPFYVRALEKALDAEPISIRQKIEAKPPVFQEGFHFIPVESAFLESLAARFRTFALDSPTRTDDIRLKNRLHVSLAYGFAPEQGVPLQDLGEEMVRVRASPWDLCFYERAGDDWILHARFPLPE